MLWGVIMAKPHISITLPAEYKAWLEKKVRKQDYGSVSHGITVLIRNEMKKEGIIKDE
jgi:Arc/MetJ-type ribon-helix-helix transcriptional regulator